MEEIPSWFKYPHCLTFICFTILPIFISPVFKGVYGPKHNSNKSIRLKFSCLTKYFLLTSVLFSYSYVVTTSAQSALMWINLNKLNGFNPSLWCPLLASYRMFSYVTGRSLLYCYFVYRANDIFNGTYLEFTKYSKYALVSWIYGIIITLVVSSSYVYFKLESWTIIPDQVGNGSYCQSDNAAADLIRYIFMWGSLNDMIYSIITIFMMVSRLFLLLTDNERKKSRGQRYEYTKESQQNAEVDTQYPPESPRDAESIQHIVSMSSLESANGLNDGSPRGFDDPTFTFPDPSVQDEQRKSRSPRLKKRQVTISKLDAVQFHDKTHGHNKLILLISKFFIILSSVVISSQVVLFIFIVFRDFVLILYSLDTIINIICLWLTFSFSDDYYNKYFCGRCCTKCCFPSVKAIALSCNQYERTYIQTHDMNKCKCIANKCCIYCRCCCFASCRYQWFCNCCSDDITPKEIYQLAKYEIELIVASTDEKSLNMSQLSSNHSQKDVMMSSIDKSEKSNDNEMPR